jgi:hypothetical protein
MAVPKRVVFGGLILFLAIPFQAADAALELLPESSYYEGSTTYSIVTDDGILFGRIDFAVYDTWNYPDEFIGEDGFENPTDDRYIYVYQIFNDELYSDEEVAYFGLLDIEDAPVSGTSSQDDLSGGVEPADCPAEGVWDFEGSFIYDGDHSVFLVLTSNTGWVPGSYEIRSGGRDVPIPDIPEPASIALLGTAGLLIFVKRPRGR